MRVRLGPIWLLALVACGKAPEPALSSPVLPSPTAVVPSSSLSVEGSAFVLTTPEGEMIRGVDLAGAVVHLSIGDGAAAPLKLASITPDPERPELLRHEFQTLDADGHWKPACTPNAYGETWGFPVTLPPGHPGRDGKITITCTSGAIAKCARFGYPPWMKGPGGEDLAPLHAACIHMVRADYCGDGTPHTKEGTTIDNYDDLGIETRGVANDPRYRFEAGWTARGAVCVAHTRWADLLTMDQLKAQCPRLAAMPVCTEASARAAGARMFNTSRIQP